MTRGGLIVASCVLFSSATPVLAADDNGDIFSILEEQEHAMTTGSRLGTTALESPSSVWTIDRKAIETTAAVDLSDLLRRIPGIVPLAFSTGDTEYAVRGMGTESVNRALFLIDGRSTNAQIYGTPVLEGLALQDIERIEVVLGPASTTYGTGAFSAVINIITRDPARNGWRVRGNGWGGIGQSGLSTAANPSNNVLDPPKPMGGGFLEYSQGFDKLRFRASVSGDMADAAALQPGSVRSINDSPIPWQRLSGMLALQYDVHGWNLLAQGFAGYENFNYTPVIIAEPAHHPTTTYTLNLKASKKDLFAAGDELTLQLWGRHLNWQWWDTIFETATGYVNDPVVENSAELLAQYVTPTFFLNRLVVGFQTRVATDDGLPDLIKGASPIGIIGLFAEDEFRPLPRLILTAGARFETRLLAAPATTSQFNIAPRGSAVFIPAPGHSLRAEVATAYRTPSTFEQLVTEVYGGGLLIFRDNLSLKPEQNVVATLSYQGTFSWLKPRIDVFFGYRSNVIGIGPAASGKTDQNFNDSESWGTSLQLTATVNRFVDLWISYCYSQAEAVNGIVPFTRFNGQFASLMPPHSGGLGGSFIWRRWTAGLQVYVTSPALDPSWQNTTLVYAPAQGRVIINPMLKYAFDEARRFQLALMATNIADIRYGSGANRDTNNPWSERIGPRVWLSLDIELPGIVASARDK